jgi:hypothetical protein
MNKTKELITDFVASTLTEDFTDATHCINTLMSVKINAKLATIRESVAADLFKEVK